MREHRTLHWPPEPLLEEQVTRFNVPRFGVLAIGAVVALVVGLAATPASAAPAAKPKAPAATTTATNTECEPAYLMTGEERATLPSVRVCNRGAGAASGTVTSPQVVQPASSVSGHITKLSSVGNFDGYYL